MEYGYHTVLPLFHLKLKTMRLYHEVIDHKYQEIPNPALWLWEFNPKDKFYHPTQRINLNDAHDLALEICERVGVECSLDEIPLKNIKSQKDRHDAEYLVSIWHLIEEMDALYDKFIESESILRVGSATFANCIAFDEDISDVTHVRFYDLDGYSDSIHLEQSLEGGKPFYRAVVGRDSFASVSLYEVQRFLFDKSLIFF